MDAAVVTTGSRDDCEEGRLVTCEGVESEAVDEVVDLGAEST